MTNTGAENSVPTGHPEVVKWLEAKIRKINQEVIPRHIPDLDAQTVLELAATVAELRARYLQAALRLKASGKHFPPDPPILNDVRQKREMYQEALSAYEALSRAIDRGYLKLEA